MKKATFCILICLLIIGLLTACGGSKQAQTPSPAPAPAPAPAPVPAFDQALIDLVNKAKAINEVYYEFQMNIGSAVMQGKSWSKGHKARTEMTMMGQKMIMLMDFEKGEIYNYMPDAKMALKMDEEFLKSQKGQKPTDYMSSLDPKNTKILETTTYDGQKCLLIGTVDKQGNTTKVWIGEKHGIPLKVEADVSGSKMVAEFKNIKLDPISDALFMLPAGVKIEQKKP